MATFEGTLKEFIDYIGPRIRNKINNATRKLRVAQARKCQHCAEEKELESAHIHEYGGRNGIIQKILLSHATSSTNFSVNLKAIEKEILDAHIPLEKNFLFLCNQCHKEYDRKQKIQKTHHKERRPHSSRLAKTHPNKTGRIELWATRPHQINHKVISAFVSISRNNKAISLKDFETTCINVGIKRAQFRTNLNSMKTDAGNSHAYVFDERNGLINIQPEAWKLIERFWPKKAK